MPWKTFAVAYWCILSADSQKNKVCRNLVVRRITAGLEFQTSVLKRKDSYLIGNVQVACRIVTVYLQKLSFLSNPDFLRKNLSPFHSSRSNQAKNLSAPKFLQPVSQERHTFHRFSDQNYLPGMRIPTLLFLSLVFILFLEQFTFLTCREVFPSF